MKWLKTIKARWLILIIVFIQLGIWIPPYLISGEVGLVIDAPQPKSQPKSAIKSDLDGLVFKEDIPEIGELSKRSAKKKKPRNLFGGRQADRSLRQIRDERKYLQSLIADGDDAKDEIIDFIQREISSLKREERALLRKHILSEAEEAKELEKLTLLAYRDDPKLKKDQPTVLIYADWFLINWQALLSIFTILPIVAVRWKNLLTGKPIAANEVK